MRPINQHFVVEVRSGCPTGGAHIGNDIAALNFLPGDYIQRAAMTIA